MEVGMIFVKILRKKPILNLSVTLQNGDFYLLISLIDTSIV